MHDSGAVSAHADTGSYSHAPAHNDTPFRAHDPIHHDHGNSGDHHHHKHHHERDDLEAGPPAYGTIERGLSGTGGVPRETTARELWERRQQQPFFTADKFFALIVFFALLALMLTWVFNAFGEGTGGLGPWR